jgi:hypothetical protein
MTRCSERRGDAAEFTGEDGAWDQVRCQSPLPGAVPETAPTQATELVRLAVGGSGFYRVGRTGTDLGI